MITQASRGPWIMEANNNRPGYYVYSEGDDCVVAHIDRSNDASPKYQAREEADALMLGAARALYDAAKMAMSGRSCSGTEMAISKGAWGALRDAIAKAEGEEE